jgi:UDP-glucose 4-epimerase
VRCLVTGGAGFIGSHLVDALIAHGDDVEVIDNLSTGRVSNLAGAISAGAVLHQLDVRDRAAIIGVFERFEPEAVFHLAAQIDVRESVADPATDAAVNVIGVINVLEAARARGVGRFVHSSTGGGLYGDADVLPTPETHPIRPLAPYGQSKLAAEGYCRLYAQLHGLSTVSLRYGNVYGPRQDVNGEAGVVAVFCGKLIEGARPTVFGDGRQTRDWVAVSDVVNANLLALSSGLADGVNIGHGRETSVLELLDALQDVGAARGLEMPPAEFAPARLGEVQRSCLNVSRARDELGWTADVTLPEGLERVLASL